jgi:hypothetical protein
VYKGPLDGSYTTANFSVANDGSGGTDIMFVA